MNKKATEREIYYSAFVNKYIDAWKALRPKHRRIEYSILDCILHGKLHHRVTYERLPSEPGKIEPAIAINIRVSEPDSCLGFSVHIKALLDQMGIAYKTFNLNPHCKVITIDLVNNMITPMATQEIRAIIIDPETNLPTLATIQGNIKQIFRGISTEQREELIDNFLPKNMFIATLEQLEPEDLITHPLNINSFDDMVDNLDEHLSDQLGETLFALPNTNKVKDILAKYQVEIYQEGTCWILCLIKDYGREFDDEINSYLPCVSHNISFSDYN